MIAPLAITLALAFWTPYAGEQPICPQGVQIVQMAPDLVAAGNDGYSWMGTKTCSIQINLKTVDRYTIPEQCALVAHELGHNLFALEHRAGTIMDPSTDTRPIPGACYPPGYASQKNQPKPDAAPSNRRHAKLHRGKHRLWLNVNRYRLYEQRLTEPGTAARRG